MDINIKFVPKEKISPALGFMYYNTNSALIEIQEGLSKFETCSLLVHEFGHMDDLENKEGFIHKELESISMSLFYPIIGTIIIALKSLTPSRLKWWRNRFINKS